MFLDAEASPAPTPVSLLVHDSDTFSFSDSFAFNGGHVCVCRLGNREGHANAGICGSCAY